MRADLDDPSWFAADYIAASRAFEFVRVPMQAIREASFLDRRLHADWSGAVRLDSAATRDVHAHEPSFLFHTAFCGSTLLSRALDTGARSIALKEPLVLHSLATAARRASWPHGAADITEDLDRALALLARPWSPGGRVLLKPANQANTLLPDLLLARPGAPAVLLFSKLEAFLVSCFKKGPDARQPIEWMAQALLHGTTLATKLGIEPSRPLNLVEAAALAWFAQMEHYARALEHDAASRLRTLDVDALLDDPLQATASAAAFLLLDADGLEQRVQAVFAADAKQTSRAYDAGVRAREHAFVAERLKPLLDDALRWAERTVAPHARMPRLHPLVD